MSIYDLTYNELELFILENNFKKFNASQVFEWLYKKRVMSFNQMTNIKKELVELLNINYEFNDIIVKDINKGKDVSKYLFELNDGAFIEAVLMKHDYGNSLCLSSQVGCNMGCTFCESGRLKKVRNLNSSEMILQILKIEQLEDLRVSHVVLMGIGEPFDNYDNVIKFIDIINHGKGIDIGARHITVSTCGIIPKIEQFMTLDKQVNLAISLHAPNNEIRSKIMPINKIYQIEDLILTLKNYIKKTNRRVTLEYIMLQGINDTKENALELSKLIKGMNAYVNLIPYNETSNIIYKRSNENTILGFYDILKQNKINVTIRREFGGTIDAACGQLRSKYEGELK